MSTEKHTQGRLAIESLRDSFEVVDEETLAITVARMSGPRAESNARRFVACWNALLDVPTEQLEQAAQLGITDVSSGNLFSSRLKLQKQRDELLAVLDDLVRTLTDQDEEGLIEHAEPMIAARAAIAKVKGGAS